MEKPLPRAPDPQLRLTSLSSAEESFPYFKATPEFMSALFRAELLLQVSGLRVRLPGLGLHGLDPSGRSPGLDSHFHPGRAVQSWRKDANAPPRGSGAERSRRGAHGRGMAAGGRAGGALAAAAAAEPARGPARPPPGPGQCHPRPPPHHPCGVSPTPMTRLAGTSRQDTAPWRGLRPAPDHTPGRRRGARKIRSAGAGQGEDAHESPSKRSCAPRREVSRWSRLEL